jgi:adenylate cyclase
LRNVPQDHTFVFADLAGFTALTEAMGDEDAADLAGNFCAQVRELAPGYSAEAIKTIGDALMLRGTDAGQAILLGLRIVNDIGGRHYWPTVRVGMHAGPATERDGDWFGTTVNVAARVSGIAAGGEVLLTEATRACSPRCRNWAARMPASTSPSRRSAAPCTW